MPATDHLEELFDTSRSLTVLIHGLQGSRRDWCERGGYSKGGDLTDRLSALGRSWIACDLYGHGDWPATEPDFSSEHISDELFPSFLSRSADATRVAIEAAVARHDVDHLQLVTYSAGCHVALQLLKGALPRPVTTLALAVPTPERAYDDEYSLHNNLDVFEGRTVGMFVGRDDDEVAFDEAWGGLGQLAGAAQRRWGDPCWGDVPGRWGRWRRAWKRSPSSPAPPSRSPAATSTGHSTSPSRCSARSPSGRWLRGCGCGATCRCASAPRGRAACRSTRWCPWPCGWPSSAATS
jgi:hypothetical protein